MTIDLIAKPFQLCSFGTVFAGEISQCQRPGYKWVEISPKVYVSYCELHVKQINSIKDEKDG